MAELILAPVVMTGEGWADYGLVDCGHGRKYERYGPYSFIRPEPQAMWTPRLERWEADGEFVPGSDEDGGGRWAYGTRAVPQDGWPLSWGEARFTAQCTPLSPPRVLPRYGPGVGLDGRAIPPRNGEGDRQRRWRGLAT